MVNGSIKIAWPVTVWVEYVPREGAIEREVTKSAMHVGLMHSVVLDHRRTTLHCSPDRYAGVANNREGSCLASPSSPRKREVGFSRAKAKKLTILWQSVDHRRFSGSNAV